MEIWKDILDYEGIYQISNLGNVKSLKFGKEKILKTNLDNNGYLILRLCKKGIIKTRTLHQLVAIAFLNHIPDGHNLVVNHKNFIRTDNRVENLEIVTQRENSNLKHLKSTSEFVGVYWCKKLKKWMTCIYMNKKLNYLGYFINEIDANNAYQKALKMVGRK